jgi:2-methylcitrate dehydratase PrpD
MEIRLKDGKVYKRFLAGPKGDPTNRFSREDMYSKFMKNATTVFPKGKMEKFFKVLEGVEEMKDVGKIASYLSKASAK